jgi:hypothetical protein
MKGKKKKRKKKQTKKKNNGFFEEKKKLPSPTPRNTTIAYIPSHSVISEREWDCKQMIKS